ncbi:hypothetical protein DKX38_004178 [Salix brachista]|uniref:PCI domain-containing protein n=1 Tax=Salix brachista TaxID=2182728 RepID=A0A5N5N9I2_9ROSI|nr:hypothetical protein DKX38_004178 [Salix brachista]
MPITKSWELKSLFILCNSALLPKLLPDQILKLKQLTVLTLSETTKVLSYNKLQEELEVSNVRELEDFLINDCMYTVGLPISASATGNMYLPSQISTSLSSQGSVIVPQFKLFAIPGLVVDVSMSISIDVVFMNSTFYIPLYVLLPLANPRGNLKLLFATFRLATSDTMLSLTEEKIDWASKMCQLNMDRQQELQGRIDEAKKNIHYKKSQNKQDLCFMEYGDGFDSLGRPLEHEDDLMRSILKWCSILYAISHSFQENMKFIDISYKKKECQWRNHHPLHVLHHSSGVGHRTVTGEGGLCTLDVSPGGKPSSWHIRMRKLSS